MPRAVAVVVAVVLCVGLPLAGETADTLRVCADPDNLPFSSEGPGARGLYVDVAELVAARLGMRTEYTWWRTYFGMRSVRSTLLADRCDVFFGLPQSGFMGRSLTMTPPFLDVGYALIAQDRSGATALKGRRVAVVFGSTPQLTLAARDGVRTVTFRLPEEALDALARGEVDAAFVWGPTAGYYNLTRLGGRYAVVPVAGEGLQWKVAAAVKKGNETLKEGLERALAQLEPEIRRLADGYGFPLTAALDLDATTSGGAEPVAPTSDVVVNPFRGDAEAIAAGRRAFNQHCGHCHGPNAFNPEPSRDLRRLKRRYADETAQVFYGAVAAGRPTKGMPTWGDVLDADTIWKIWAFLETVQLEP